MKRLLLIVLVLSMMHCVPVDHSVHNEGPAPPDSGISPKGVNTSGTKSDANTSNVVTDIAFEKPTNSSTYDDSESAESLWCIQQKAAVCAEMERWATEGLIEGKKHIWLCRGPGIKKFKCE